MNLLAFTGVAQGAVFKTVAKDGVSVIEYTFFRHSGILIFSVIQSWWKKQNPLKNFPRKYIKDLLIRSIAGQLVFALVNMSLVLIPISTTMVIFMMNPFWTAILACLILRERIQIIEIIGIFICFGGVVMIWYSKS